MRPTLNLNFRNGARDFQMALHSPMQGFDSLRIISQMISLQCLHYLVLSLILPGLLSTLSFNRSALQYQGGAVSLSMILDWREIAGHPITDGGSAWPWGFKERDRIVSVPQMEYLERAGLMTSSREDMGGLNKWWEWDLYLRADSLHWTKEHDEGISWDRKRVGKGRTFQSSVPMETVKKDSSAPVWWNLFARDSSRGWIIVLAWAITGAVDVFLLSTLIRRPTHILDHTLTLHFFHLILTSLYTRHIPTSLFYWLVMLAHSGACVVWAEALSIRRELQSNWMPDWENANHTNNEDSQDDQERARLLISDQTPSMRQANGNRSVTTHVLFEEGEVDFDVEDDGESKKKGLKGVNGHRHESIEMKRLD